MLKVTELYDLIRSFKNKVKSRANSKSQLIGFFCKTDTLIFKQNVKWKITLYILIHIDFRIFCFLELLLFISILRFFRVDERSSDT